jgi:hypothetical protein
MSAGPRDAVGYARIITAAAAGRKHFAAGPFSWQELAGARREVTQQALMIGQSSIDGPWQAKTFVFLPLAA